MFYNVTPEDYLQTVNGSVIKQTFLMILLI